MVRIAARRSARAALDQSRRSRRRSGVGEAAAGQGESRVTSNTILLETKNGVATLTFNRPDVLNATNDEFYREFARLIRQIAEDGQIGCVVMTGAGRGFCAGAD